MLSSSLKKDVQKLWNAFWSGGIANPLTAIEQITYLIYLKQIDELGNYPAFFDVEGGDRYRWRNFHLLPGGPDATLKFLKTEVFERLRGMENGGRMNGAELLINSPNLLATAIKIIDDLFVTSRNQDTLGDIYELLLSEIAIAGKNGQFRTPRQIIRLMCDLLDPRFGERICDPAAGTGGFLVNAFQHMQKREAPRDALEFEANGTPFNFQGHMDEARHEQLRQGEMFVGYDFDQTMVRLGWMNMTLHGIHNPQLNYADTLNRAFDTNVFHQLDFKPFNVIFANPPFKGSINSNDIAESLSLELKTDKTELLFVERIFQMLDEDGRAAIILPEGVLFGGTNAHKALREKLLTQTRIKAIISLPGGTFAPYTGVKTSILIFQKGGSTDRVWFYELAQDGQTLDAKRTERPYQNDAWDVTVRYAARYPKDHLFEPPAFVHPKRAQEWEQWRAMDDDTRRQSYVLPLFNHQDRLNEQGYSVFPTTLEAASEQYAVQRQAEQQIAALVQERLNAAEQGALIKALITLRTQGKGDREQKALADGSTYLKNKIKEIRNVFERAAEGVLMITGEERHGLDALNNAVNIGLGDTAAWTEAAMVEVADVLANTLDDRQDLKAVLADLETVESIDLAPLIAPFRLLDGVDTETFGRLRLITPQLHEQVAELKGRLSGPFAPALPKEWEIPVGEITANDTNMSAGRYKPFSLVATIHEKPKKIIEDLVILEGNIQQGLATLLNMVEGRG